MSIVTLDVADTGRLHLTSSGRSLCGLRIDQRDVHEPEAGWRLWEERAGDRCGRCVVRLERAREAAA